MNFPLAAFTNVSALNPWTYLVFGLIGFAFGFVLEISGFGNSKKLAAQFYFTEMTVLKVMFTAIVVAMVLIAIATGLGILDINQVWINPTYLWPGIVGGLIMGVGFIIGGFCPGTSLVSMATLKVDGLFFVLGSLFGIFLFGETVQYFEGFWESSNYGRLTLMDWLGLTTGQVVLIIVLMALLMFAFAELMESFIGKRDLKAEPKLRIAGAALLIAGAVAVLIIGQPTLSEKWAKISSTKEASLAAREVQISPAELLSTKANDGLRLVMLDIRPESEYNLFHIDGAINVQPEALEEVAADIISQSAPNLVVAVMSNDEDAATEAWKVLTAASVANVYILEGGINNWITAFGKEESQITPITSEQVENDSLRYLFESALGGRYECSDPNLHKFDLEYEPKIKLELKRDKSGGGCG
jgi:hypothetical protein